MASTPELWNQEFPIKAFCPPSKWEEIGTLGKRKKPTLMTLYSLSQQAKTALQVLCRDEWCQKGYPIMASSGRKKGQIITNSACKELCDAGLLFSCGGQMDMEIRRKIPRYKVKPIAISLAAEAGWVRL